MRLKKLFVTADQHRDGALCRLMNAARDRGFQRFNAMLGRELGHSLDLFLAIGGILDPCAALLQAREDAVLAR